MASMHKEDVVDARRVFAQARKVVEEAESDGQRCRAATRNGSPCRRPGLPGTDLCALHTRQARAGKTHRPHAEAQPRPAERRRLRQDIEERLKALLERLQAADILRQVPAEKVLAAFRQALASVLPSQQQSLLSGLDGILSAAMLDPDVWKGALFVIQNFVHGRIETSKRRSRGDYEVDPYGLDEDFYHGMRPLFTLMYKYWFRVSHVGLDNVPESGRALMVCNHSGVLPLDGAMISEAIWDAHPSPRYVRWLFLKLFASLPFLAPILSKVGGVMGCPENGERLLSEDQLVGVFPEGLKGIGKLFKDRYHLARFGRGGFIQIAMRTRAPIIPVSVVGAEETYPALYYLDFISKPLGMPYLPITPTFPLLGPLGFIPLPSKWTIQFGTPIRFTEKAPAKADDFLIVSLLTEKVRQAVQDNIDRLLAQRTSVF